MLEINVSQEVAVIHLILIKFHWQSAGKEIKVHLQTGKQLEQKLFLELGEEVCHQIVISLEIPPLLFRKRYLEPDHKVDQGVDPMLDRDLPISHEGVYLERAQKILRSQQHLQDPLHALAEVHLYSLKVDQGPDLLPKN